MRNFNIVFLLFVASSISFAQNNKKESTLPNLKISQTSNSKLLLTWGKSNDNPLDFKGQGSCKGLVEIDAELQASTDLVKWNLDSQIVLSGDGFSAERPMTGPRGFWRLKYKKIRTTAIDVVMVCQDSKHLKCFRGTKVPPPFEKYPTGPCNSFGIDEFHGYDSTAVESPKSVEELLDEKTH